MQTRREFLKIGVGFGLALAGISCTQTREELSDVVYEEAVVGKKYVDSFVSVLPTIGADGSISVSVSSTPEEYDITFHNQNIDFKFDDKDLYDKFLEGEKVVVGYQNVAEITSDSSNKIVATNRFKKFVGVEKKAETIENINP